MNTWTGKTGNSNMNDPANWSEGKAPAKGDQIILGPYQLSVFFDPVRDTAQIPNGCKVTGEVADEPKPINFREFL